MEVNFKKGWLIFIGIIILFIVLNPNYKRFKEFRGSEYNIKNVKKPYNFLVCSVYVDTYYGKKYLGILLNFIDITPEK